MVEEGGGDGDSGVAKGICLAKMRICDEKGFAIRPIHGPIRIEAQGGGLAANG